MRGCSRIALKSLLRFLYSGLNFQSYGADLQADITVKSNTSDTEAFATAMKDLSTTVKTKFEHDWLIDTKYIDDYDTTHRSRILEYDKRISSLLNATNWQLIGELFEKGHASKDSNEYSKAVKVITALSETCEKLQVARGIFRPINVNFVPFTNADLAKRMRTVIEEKFRLQFRYLQTTFDQANFITEELKNLDEIEKHFNKNLKKGTESAIRTYVEELNAAGRRIVSSDAAGVSMESVRQFDHFS